MKRKIAMLMTMILLLSVMQVGVVVADDQKNSDDSETESIIEDAKNGKIVELSIDDAVNLAKESSREMWKIDDALKQVQESRKAARNAKEQAESLMSMSLEDISKYKSLAGVSPINDYVESLLAKNDYYKIYADAQTSQLEKNKDILNIGIEISTKSLYYNVLVAEKTIEIDEAKLNSANEQLRVVNLNFDNGSATKAEILNGELAVQQAQTELDTAKDDLELAKLDLLNKIDLPLGTKINLSDKELNYVPTEKLDLDAAIEKAKKDRTEILTAENNLELQKIETHVYKSYYTSNLRQYKSAVEKLKDAEINVPQAYKDVELDVRQKYLNLVKDERALNNMDKTVELAKEAQRVKNLLYENGMAASLDVIEADTSLAEAQIGRYQLLVKYNISKLLFENSNLMSSEQ